jgi:AraC-like DNA-binding protein
MIDPQPLLIAFVHGLAAGVMAAMAATVVSSRLSPQVRWVTGLVGLSIVTWLITEAQPLWAALGHVYILVALAYPVAGLFWLFIATVFEDRPIGPWMFAPAVVMLLSGFWMSAAHPPSYEPIWYARNLASGVLAVHAGVMVARGWRDDLLEARRRLRAVLLGLTTLFVAVEVGLGFAVRLDPSHNWLEWTVGRTGGGAVFAVLILALAASFLQPRPGIFGVTRRVPPVEDPRAEAEHRQILQKLDALMAAESWRREGLTIGQLADELSVPEHRLRRLINNRLGHRNFADFLNAHRIEAAKRRLADPAAARTTVAVIAFDLGYGSLGPFNRAFRAATGATPTEWRRQALSGSPDLRQAV